MKSVLACAMVAAFSIFQPSAGVTASAEPEPAGSPPAPTVSPTPSSGVKPVMNQLREIGRVRAKTLFCSRLESAASGAALSSIAFEALLYKTARDFGTLNIDDALRKRKSLDALEKDIRTLGILGVSGRKELEGLRNLDATAPTGGAKSAIALRDALDGAKDRQYELAKELAHVYARLAGRKTHSIVDLPVDNLDPTLQYLNYNDLIDTGNDEIIAEANGAVAVALPENADILRDLKIASTHALDALNAGKC